MTASRHRLFALVAYALAAGTGFACTAIFAPKDDVQRCGSADECEATGDPRYVAECRFDPDNMDLDTTEIDKICVASFRVASCDPDGYSGAGGMHPYRVAFDTLSGVDRYGICPMDAPAPRGCRRASGFECEDGLVDNVLGFCDVPDPEVPAYHLPDADRIVYADDPDFIVMDEELRGQDIADAFCQSFFCEGDWVCDRLNGNQCVRCDPDLPIGAGGCGQVYVAGAPSCVYPGAALECGDGNTDIDEPRFGACM
jgi:hypothetical protein